MSEKKVPLHKRWAEEDWPTKLSDQMPETATPIKDYIEQARKRREHRLQVKKQNRGQ